MGDYAFVATGFAVCVSAVGVSNLNTGLGGY